MWAIISTVLFFVFFYNRQCPTELHNNNFIITCKNISLIMPLCSVYFVCFFLLFLLCCSSLLVGPMLLSKRGKGRKKGGGQRARERGWICWFTKDSNTTSVPSHTPTLPLSPHLSCSLSLSLSLALCVSLGLSLGPHPLLARWYSSRNRKEPQLYK